jgi:inhibitor of cysteine peptidase
MRPVELAQEDSGRRRTLSVGEVLVIRLAENPTTGYRWQAEFDSGRLQASDDRFEPSSDLPGAAGMRYLTFRALAPGETRLRLVNRRAWESGDGIAEFAIDLDVTANQ